MRTNVILPNSPRGSSRQPRNQDTLIFDSWSQKILNRERYTENYSAVHSCFRSIRLWLWGIRNFEYVASFFLPSEKYLRYDQHAFSPSKCEMLLWDLSGSKPNLVIAEKQLGEVDRFKF